MDKKNTHIKIVDEILDQKIVSDDFMPSIDFVDRVMKELDGDNNVTSLGKLFKVAVNVAAIALLFFTTNSLIVFSSLRNNDQQQVDNDWKYLYEQNNSLSWYDYYESDELIANNQTNDSYEK